MTHKPTQSFSAKEIEDYQKMSEEEIAKALLEKKTEGTEAVSLKANKPDLRNTATDFVINETLTKNFSAQNTSRILSEEEATNLLMHEVMAIQKGVAKKASFELVDEVNDRKTHLSLVEAVKSGDIAAATAALSAGATLTYKEPELLVEQDNIVTPNPAAIRQKFIASNKKVKPQ